MAETLRDALHQTIIHAAITLLTSPDWQQDLCGFLRSLASAARVDRAALIKLVSHGGLLVCEWRKDNFSHQDVVNGCDNPPVDSMEYIAFLEEHVPSGEPRTGQPTTNPLKDSSLISIPIEGDEKWGWLVLEDCDPARTWHADELEPLNLAADLLLAAWKRSTQAKAVISSEIRLRTLFEQIPAVVYTADFSDMPHITWVSPQVEQFMGWKPGEYIADADRWLQQVYPEDQSRVEKILNAAITSKSAFTVECRLRTRNGSVVWFRHDASLIFDPSGKPRHIQGVLQDVNRGKTIEAELNHLYREEHLQRLMVEGLTVTSSALSATMDLEKIPDLLLQELAHVIPYDTATFWFVEGDDLVLSRARGYSMIFGENVDRFLEKRISLSQAHLLKSILDTGRPVIFERVSPGRNQVPHSFSKHIHSWAGAPILNQGKPFAIFTIESRESGRFTGKMRSILQAICGQASLSFQNAQLLLTEKQLRLRAEMLQKATAALTAELELPQLLEQVMDFLGGVVSYDSVCIFLYEADHQALRAVAGRGFAQPEKILGKLYNADNALLTWVYHQKKPLILDDTLNDPRFERWGDSEHTRGWMGVPLIFREKVIGYMTMDSREANTYNEESAQFAQAFANQAASAIEISRLFGEMQSFAQTDPLTGTLNRRQFYDQAAQLIAKADEESQTLSAIMVDIDNYKTVNDTLGHLTGDQILKVVADCFASNLNPQDLLARVGGDEFTVLLPNHSHAQAEVVAERLRSSLENAAIVVNNTRVDITASFGVAEIDPAWMDLDEMINRADQALYRSKNAGRNTVS